MPNKATIKKHILYIALVLISSVSLLVLVHNIAQRMHIAQTKIGVIQSYPHVKYDKDLYHKAHPGSFIIDVDLPEGIMIPTPNRHRVSLLYITLLAIITIYFVIRLLILVYALIRKQKRQYRFIQALFVGLAYPAIFTLLVVTGMDKTSDVISTAFRLCFVLGTLHAGYLIVMQRISKNENQTKKTWRKLTVLLYALAGLGLLWLGFGYIQTITHVCLGIQCPLYID